MPPAPPANGSPERVRAYSVRVAIGSLHSLQLGSWLPVNSSSQRASASSVHAATAGSPHLPQLTSWPLTVEMRSLFTGEHSWISPSSLKQIPSLLTFQKQLSLSSTHSWA